MSDFFVKAVRLNGIEKHSNADSLSIVGVGGEDGSPGNPVIFSTKDFKEGDLVSYVPVDSIVPDTEQWSFLKGHRRIKARKLRGIFSMGLLCQLPPGNWKEGDNLQEALGITKWEPDVDHEIPNDPWTGPKLKGWGPIFWAKKLYYYWKFGRQKLTGTPKFIFPEFTDVESLRKWGKVLQEGEEVVATEKIHGCVISSTRVTLFDGSHKTILQVKEGDEVLGVGPKGNVCSSKILRKYKNGRTTHWLKISGQKRGMGRGSSFFSVQCTPEHRFWSKEKGGFSLASSLKEGDQVSIIRTDPGLIPIQKQVLLGKMLGDGSLCMNGVSGHLSYGHITEHKPYLEWTSRALMGLSSQVFEDRISGYGSEMTKTRTTNSPFIKEYLESFIENGVKIVPNWVEEELGPISLAFWYMDDGSLGHHMGQEDRANFAVCGFTEKDCGVLIRGLKRFGIEATYYKAEGFSRLRLNCEEAEKLFLLISPYVPPVMQYKLPERYRGHPGWIPSFAQYKPQVVEATIEKIEEVWQNVERYDLETDTHNYFANGILVHNSNARFAFHKKHFWVGSHHQFKGRPKTGKADNFWQAAFNANLETKLAKAPGIAFYGEVYGKVQKGFPYDKPGDVRVRFFDAMNLTTLKYLSRDYFLILCGRLDLETVPELYRGPWKESLKELSEGQSVLAKHIREGMVVKPVVERYDSKLGRVILKMVGEAYLTSKDS